MRPAGWSMLLTGAALLGGVSARAQPAVTEKPGEVRIRSAGNCEVRLGERSPLRLRPRESKDLKLAPGLYQLHAESAFAKLRKDYPVEVVSGRTVEIEVDLTVLARDALAEKGVAVDPGAAFDAVRKNRADLVRLLLDAGISVDEKDGEGRPLLLAAADLGHREAAQTLLEATPDLDATDRLDRTATMWAALRGHAGIVNDLAGGGADLNRKDKILKDTPLMLAAAWGHTGVVTALINQGAGQARRSGVVGSILGKGGLDLDETNRMGWTALMYAARFGHTEIARVLVEAGAKTDRRDDLQRTAAMLAREAGHEATAAYLDSVSVRAK